MFTITHISKAGTLPAGMQRCVTSTAQLPGLPTRADRQECFQTTSAPLHGVPGGGFSHCGKGCDVYVVTSKEILEFERGAMSLELEGRSRGSLPRAPVGRAVLRA